MSAELQEIEQEILRLKAKRTEIRKREPREAVEDYCLQGPAGTSVPLSELFGDRSDLLVIHNMGKGCPYCTLWADGLNGLLPHLENRMSAPAAPGSAPAMTTALHGLSSKCSQMGSTTGSRSTTTHIPRPEVRASFAFSSLPGRREQSPRPRSDH